MVHVDESCRVQTVRPENNPKLRRLLGEFFKLTECPILLNTSFNMKGQPIVNRPEEAIECFKKTNIDLLVLGDYVLDKEQSWRLP